MKEVGIFAINEYKSRRRREIEEIRIVRHELKGSGCWRRTYTDRLSIENPLLENKLDPNMLPPQFRR